MSLAPSYVEGIEMTLWLGTKKEYLDTVLQWLDHIAEGMSGLVLLVANEYSATYNNVTRRGIILEKAFSPSTADDLLETIKTKRMNPVEILIVAKQHWSQSSFGWVASYSDDGKNVWPYMNDDEG